MGFMRDAPVFGTAGVDGSHACLVMSPLADVGCGAWVVLRVPDASMSGTGWLHVAPGGDFDAVRGNYAPPDVVFCPMAAAGSGVRVGFCMRGAPMPGTVAVDGTSWCLGMWPACCHAVGCV